MKLEAPLKSTFFYHACTFFKSDHLVCLLVAILLLPLFYVDSCEGADDNNTGGLELQYHLNAFWDSDHKKIIGIEYLAITNKTEKPLAELLVHLYPNYLDHKSNDSPERYPKGFNIGHLKVISIRSVSKGRQRTPLHFRPARSNTGVPLLPVSPGASDATLISVALHRPLNMGETVLLEINFQTTIPERTGLFSYSDKNGGLLVLQGGWYPYLPEFKKGRWLIKGRPHKADIFASLGMKSLDGLRVVTTGEVRQKKRGDRITRLLISARGARTISIVAGRLFKLNKKYMDTEINVYSIKQADGAGMMNLAVSTLDYFMKRYDRSDIKRVNIAEVYLQDKLYANGDGLFMYSHKFLNVFGFFKKYHKQKMTEGMLDHLWALSTDNDLWVNEGLAYMDNTEFFSHKKQVSIKKYLARISFIPDVDKLLYSSSLPLRNTYFNKTVIRAPREDFWYFNSSRPHGSVIFEKIDALLGENHLYDLYSAYPELFDEPFEKQLNSNGNIRWFYNQWRYSNPPVDYRIKKVKISKESKPGEHHGKGKYLSVIEVYKSEHLFESVELEVKFRNRRKKRFKWDGMRKNGRFSIYYDSPVTRLRVDPAHLLNDPNRDNNSLPEEWKVLLEDFNAKYDIQTRFFEYRLGLAFQPIYTSNKIVRLRLENTQESIRGSLAYTYLFYGKGLLNVKQSVTGTLSADRVRTPVFGAVVGSRTDIRIAHVIGSSNFPLYNSTLRSLLSGLLPYSTLTTSFTQQTTGQGHPHTIQMLLEARKSFKFSGRHRLLASLKLGETFSKSQNEVFFLGGSKGIKGYTELALSGQDIITVIMEYFTPILPMIEKNMGSLWFLHSFNGILFTSVGTVANNRRQIFTPSGYKKDVGFGVTSSMETAGVYPVTLRLDVAFPVKPVLKNEAKPHYYVSFGSRF